MIRILLCSEGVTDHGRDDYCDGEFVHCDGALQVLIKKLAPSKELSFSVKERSDIKRFTLAPSPGRFTPKDQIKAKKLAAIAKIEDCLHIAYHRDEDNNGFEEMYTQVHSYFTVAESVGIRCIAIVPQHMTESWLLSDAGAFSKTPDNPALPNTPEETWGNKDSDRHPKKYLKRVLSQFHLAPSADTYRDIAEDSCVEVVRTRCPKSFGRLCDDIKGFLGEDEAGFVQNSL